MRALAAEGWVEAPLQRFVDDSRVSFAVLLHPTGQVLGQFGFTRAVDVMAACALVAAIRATAARLGTELGGEPFREMHQAGGSRQIFVAEADTAHGPILLLAAFDGESSLGLVQLYFRGLRSALAQAAPALAPVVESGAMFGADLERDLHRSLAILFGRAQPPTRDGGVSISPA